MTLPYDQRVAKLRILIRRADAGLRAQQRIYDAVVRKAYEPVHAAEEERVRLFSQLYAVAEELGFCGGCEKPRNECRCIAMAQF